MQQAAVTTIAQPETGAVLVAAPASRPLRVFGAVIAAAGGNTGTPSVAVRLGANEVFKHPGVPAGGGLAIAGFNVAGEQGDSILIDCDDPGGSVSVMVAYSVD